MAQTSHQYGPGHTTFSCLNEAYVLYLFSRPNGETRDVRDHRNRAPCGAARPLDSSAAGGAAHQGQARAEDRRVPQPRVSIAEIAAREGVTEKRTRAIVRECLARRMPAPPAEFLALQVSRLNEALLVAYSAMSGANLHAVDRVVKIVRELDRYHGLFVSPERRSSASEPRLEAPAQSPLALAAPPRACPEMAPQTAEMLQSAQMAPEPLDTN
jgi:hypothetical protein